jgi:hypothetical protein
VKLSVSNWNARYKHILLISLLIFVWFLIGVPALAGCGANGGTPAGTMRAFLHAADKQDIDQAYATFATDEVQREDIDKLVKDQVLFQGFQDLKVDKWVVFAPPNSQRGRLTGTISYSSGHVGKFETEMLQTSNGWRLTQVNITVPGERVIQFGLQRAEPTTTPVQ